MNSIRPPTFEDIAGFFYLAVSSRSMDPELLIEWADECLIKGQGPEPRLSAVSMNADAPFSVILTDLKPLCGELNKGAAKPLFLAYARRLALKMPGQTKMIYQLVEQFLNFRLGRLETEDFYDEDEIKALRELDYAYDDCNCSREDAEQSGALELKDFLDRYAAYDGYLPAVIQGRERLL